MRQECVPVRSAWKRWITGVRCGVYPHTPLTSWSTRSTSRFRCRGARYVSVGVRVFRSEGLEMLKSMSSFHFANLHNLTTANWNSVVAQKCWFLWTNRLLVPFFAFDTRRCLAVATVLAPPSDVCCGSCVLNQCSRSAAIATCFLCGPSARQSHAVTCFSFTICDWRFCRYHLSCRYRSSMCVCFFSQHFCSVHEPFDAIASLHCNYMFSLKAFQFKKH